VIFWRIYSGNCVPNFTRKARVCRRYYKKHFSLFRGHTVEFVSTTESKRNICIRGRVGAKQRCLSAGHVLEDLLITVRSLYWKLNGW